MTSGMDDDSAARAIVEHAAAEAAEDVRDAYRYGAERCESPIERILLASFIHPRVAHEWDMPATVLSPPSGSFEHVAPPPRNGLYLWPQIQVGPYRVDFIVSAVTQVGNRPFYVIECDGHDFHEKTKEQAQRDKARDRYLIGRGLSVLRFTGSEIFNDSEKVWNEIVAVVLGLCD